MSPITFALECPVCLDTIRYPVVLPCGHLICDPCIREHVSATSKNAFEANCPVCRALFPGVLPNLSLIPKKYHIFINPPLRRVYLGDGVDNEAVINDLNSEIVRFKAIIETLKSDNESAKRESCYVLDKAKEDARLALDKVKLVAQLSREKVLDDLRLANLSLEECRAENNALKSQVRKSRLPVFGDTSERFAFTFGTPSKGTSPRFGTVASAQSESSTVSTGNNMPSQAANQETAATTSVAGESTPILDRLPTPPLLYPYTSPVIQPHHNLPFDPPTNWGTLNSLDR